MKMTKKRIIYTVIVTLIVVFSSTFAVLMTLERTDYRNYLQGEYSKNMYELIDSVKNIRINLSKSAIVGSREQGIVVFEEIFRNASMANDKLNSLPINQQATGDTTKFLSQVGDFCYTLSKKSTEGKDLSNDDYNNIDMLKDQSFKLEKQLNLLANDIGAGKIKWGEIRRKATGVLAKNGASDSIEEKFKGIQKQVVQYPSLIYDGPFSDNILKINPKINSEKIVSKEDAEKRVKEVIGKNRIEKIVLEGKQGKSYIDTYRFNILIKGRKDKNQNIICEVTKHGGKILYMIDNRSLEVASINAKQAEEKANKYLRSLGYNSMTPKYTLTYDNYIVINYVYKQGDITIYPDQIKIKIALDNGDVIGIEAEKYLIAHEEKRNIQSPKITRQQAQSRVGKRLNINSVKLAIIPTETNKEVLCYEFTGNYKGDNFIVYINSLTGYEQKIIQIINTPNGELTM
ncbi:sporulation protein YpeB [Clostridium acetireducens DSM 10703]|jgi:spore germination protein|uniref:Sporulation protein YpeB n=1 Tax=Clostridium acetireducens DSM 10703 TaxID=1121290 RepID=A0A1E8EYW0_9CLOT|nr:germination protein YpeB [Clostridium acetireducens]OFI06186.1 sporulation protein YpeB [Clostridium acetireducens DSM 10703]